MKARQPLEIFSSLGAEEIEVATYYPERNGGVLEYEPTWVSHPHAYPLSPALPLMRGKQRLMSVAEKLPALLSDSAPDRWGRMLIQRDFAANGRQPTEVDYLLGVADRYRLGALRFFVEGTAQAPISRVPKVLELADLERAARLVQEGSSSIEVVQRIAQAGSSLGGARPKATVVAEDGRLMMAKFSSTDDTIDVVSWEKVCLDIARAAGIRVPASRILHVNRRPVLLVERFDRLYDDLGNEHRVPYMSALTLLDLSDGQRSSMVEIAEALQPVASDAANDLGELFSRAALNLLVGNTDNHLRNHGFLRTDSGWTLSPLFDVNPATTKTDFATSVDVATEDSVDSLMGAAEWFGLTQEQALSRLQAIVDSTSSWRDLARQHGIPSAQDALVQAGFDGPHLARAKQWLTEG